MNIILATVTRKGLRLDAARQLVDLYIKRASKYVPCAVEEFASEAALLSSLEKRSGRTAPFLVCTDSRGEQITSGKLAAEVARVADSGAQTLAFAIGPADGWSPTALARANLKIAFGRITLPHELAAVVAAEQLYRALTIRAGHPYHSGH